VIAAVVAVVLMALGGGIAMPGNMKVAGVQPCLVRHGIPEICVLGLPERVVIVNATYDEVFQNVGADTGFGQSDRFCRDGGTIISNRHFQMLGGIWSYITNLKPFHFYPTEKGLGVLRSAYSSYDAEPHPVGGGIPVVLEPNMEARGGRFPSQFYLGHIGEDVGPELSLRGLLGNVSGPESMTVGPPSGSRREDGLPGDLPRLSQIEVDQPDAQYGGEKPRERDDQQAEGPFGHILLSVQIIFGVTLVLLGLALAREASDPSDRTVPSEARIIDSWLSFSACLVGGLFALFGVMVLIG